MDGRLADSEVMIRALRWGLAWLSSAVRVAMLREIRGGVVAEMGCVV